MIETNPIRARIAELSERVETLRGYLDYPAKRERLEEVSRELENPNIWDDPRHAQDLGRERARLAEFVEGLDTIAHGLTDAGELLELSSDEGDDASVQAVAHDVGGLEERVVRLEFHRMFSGEMDAANAFVDIQAGAGGTEAMDWASMLLRMYLRWAEERGWQTELMEESEGETAGIKSATFRVAGDYAYGWLKTEIGVHRLVRKSPFDSDNRRHTSFASVFVSPEVDDTIDIEINPADIKMDVYRSSGAGGQHVNKTESAIRITHLPTGIVVECQDERSQHKNRARAMALLKARLLDRERTEQAANQAASRKLQVGSGDRSQRIRTYNFPQGRVTDHRINLTLYRLPEILDGDLDELTAALARAARAEALGALPDSP
ncbi:MAG TPA: peptide chain release factor 2 [Rhodanobacteraceae bacterium]